MKVTKLHLEILKAHILKYDTEERREAYRQGNFPRADKVKDLNKRYRWSLYNLAERETRFVPHTLGNLFKLGNVYSENHVDTALRKLVKPL